MFPFSLNSLILYFSSSEKNILFPFNTAGQNLVVHQYWSLMLGMQERGKWARDTEKLLKYKLIPHV